MIILPTKAISMFHLTNSTTSVRRLWLSIAILIPAIFISACVEEGMTQPAAYVENSTPAPQGPIEQKYRARGPWNAVSTAASNTVCDREGNLCDIWYPTELGRNPITGQSEGFQHPVIVWANGSGQSSSKYAYYLEHLASWGFVVVASRDRTSGNGDTTLDAAKSSARRRSEKSQFTPDSAVRPIFA